MTSFRTYVSRTIMTHLSPCKLVHRKSTLRNNFQGNFSLIRRKHGPEPAFPIAFCESLKNLMSCESFPFVSDLERTFLMRKIRVLTFPAKKSIKTMKLI